jgi:alginate O-acetyltransferase complex protein AlgI
MLFSSPIFLYLFLPLVLLLTYLSPKKIQNYTLLIASLLFYAWGGVSFLALLMTSVTLNYTFGLLVNYAKTQRRKTIFLGIGVVLNLSLLVYFKYANFIVLNLKESGFYSGELSKIVLPIGISFFTFHAMSYLIDVYRDQAHIQNNFAKLTLYLSLFPQLIAGPIVRYKDVDKQIESRSMSVDKFSSGIRRFMLGLMRKVLIANPMALIADQAFNSDPHSLSIAMAWLGIIAYSVQIYYDFAGYSDMALGLGRMLGFEFLENFNFPYIAKSIKDFWHRWHISLSTWFRDYLYIPLGGNRLGGVRTYVNLAIVFFLTGLWHGAAWNFVVWGLIHGFFLIIERLGFEKFIKRFPTIVQHLYTLLVVLFAWIFFRANDFAHAIKYIKAMFGQFDFAFNNVSVLEFVNYDTIIILTIAFLGATPIFETLIKKWNNFHNNHISFLSTVSLHSYQLASIFFLIFGLLYSTMQLITNSYNPFIYFRF